MSGSAPPRGAVARRVLWLAVAAGGLWAAPALGQAASPAEGPTLAERQARLAGERLEAQRRLDAALVACAERFSRTGCELEAREAHRSTSQRLRAEGHALADAERRERAAQRLQQIAQRVSEAPASAPARAAQASVSAEAPVVAPAAVASPGEAAAMTPSPSAWPAAAAEGHGAEAPAPTGWASPAVPAAAATGPEPGALRPGASTAGHGPRSGVAVGQGAAVPSGAGGGTAAARARAEAQAQVVETLRQARAAAALQAWERRQAQARSHAEEVNRRNAEQDARRPPAAGLPVPAAPDPGVPRAASGAGPARPGAR